MGDAGDGEREAKAAKPDMPNIVLGRLNFAGDREQK
jgi:hypothetical protein